MPLMIDQILQTVPKYSDQPSGSDYSEQLDKSQLFLDPL